MQDSAKLLLCAVGGLSALLLAGCATEVQRPPDWQAEAIAPAPPPPEAPVPVPAPETPPPPPPAAAPPTNQFTETWIPLNRWCAANGINRTCPLSLDSFPAFALNTSNGCFVLRTGSPLAQWDGFDIRLAYSPQLIGGEPFIHRLDLTKTLQPLVVGVPMPSLATNPTIVIDPGHGGEDSGTRSILGNGYERDFTLDWARRLEQLLSARGWQVFLTRSNDVHLSLSNRVTFAEEHNAGLFVSLHFNSAGLNEREAGLETYCLTPSGMFSSVTRGFNDDPTLKFPNNTFDAQNLALAFRVHRALLTASKDRDRGVRRARYLSVLRGQNRPAILIEGGYLSNPQEARRIADPAYRQKLAEGVANALTTLPELTSRATNAAAQ